MNLVRFNNPRYATNKVLVDELFNNFFRNDYHEDYVKNDGKTPATNVFETDKEFKLEVLLPGFTKEDLQLNVHNSVLTIKVEKEKKEEKRKDSVHHGKQRLHGLYVPSLRGGWGSKKKKILRGAYGKDHQDTDTVELQRRSDQAIFFWARC